MDEEIQKQIQIHLNEIVKLLSRDKLKLIGSFTLDHSYSHSNPNVIDFHITFKAIESIN